MAQILPGESHTFGEYLFLPGYTSEECTPANVNLSTPLVKYRKGKEPCPITLNIPLVSAIMQSVSDDRMAIALAREGGISFIYGSQSVESEAAMVARVKNYKAGFVVSDSNVTPEDTLGDVLALVEAKGHNTIAVTEDGTAQGRLPREPHGTRPQSEGIHDPPRKTHHRTGGHHPQRSERHHLGA